MISVLIPVYNQEVNTLVRDLLTCAEQVDCPVEILCMDDGSSSKYLAQNRVLYDLPHTRYIVLETNVGRAKIRNKLAHEARYEYLLFLDGDSGIPDTLFLQRYVDQCAPVVNGGRRYEDAPSDPKYMLHWKYGSTRESRSVAERIQQPCNYFHSNNFLIQKDVALRHPFPEDIAGYGYEDLAFAHELKLQGVPILHIENPTIHLQLDDHDAFIQKSIQSSQNLYGYYKAGVITDTLLTRTYERLRRYGLLPLLMKAYPYCESCIHKNLRSERPSIALVHLLKLYHFSLFSRL